MPLKSFVFLKKVDVVLEKIAKYKPNTRRSYLISIVSFLKQEPKMRKWYAEYYKILMQYNTDLKSNTTKSETQLANWMTSDEINKVYTHFEEKVAAFKDKKRLNSLEYEILLEYTVLSLYTLNAPRRNADYQKMLVSLLPQPPESKEANYYCFPSQEFIFNKYKTEKTYKAQVVPVSEALQANLKLYLSKHPLKKLMKKRSNLVPLLVTYNGEPLKHANSITRILNKIFGKRVGVSMLRNIYLTSKYADVSKDLSHDVADMGTSVNMGLNNYVKVDT